MVKKLKDYGLTIQVVANHEFGEIIDKAIPNILWVINRNIVGSLKASLNNKQYVIAEHGDIF